MTCSLSRTVDVRLSVFHSDDDVGRDVCRHFQRGPAGRRCRFSGRMSCAFAEGRYLRRYPQCFTDSSGAVAGVVGGIGSVGGIIYPLAYSSSLFSSLHVGYTVVAVSIVHIVLLNTWICRPKFPTVRMSMGSSTGRPTLKFLLATTDDRAVKPTVVCLWIWLNGILPSVRAQVSRLGYYGLQFIRATCSRSENALPSVEQANRWVCQPAIIPTRSRLREIHLSDFSSVPKLSLFSGL